MKVTGQWKEGRFAPEQQEAEIFYPDGNRFVGKLSLGVKSGAGEYWYSNGDHFKGKFLDNLKSEGVFTSAGSKGIRTDIEDKIQRGFTGN